MPKPKLLLEKYKGKKVEIRFTEHQKKRITQIAKINKMTTSDFIRFCIAYTIKTNTNVFLKIVEK